jgi:hypothetical protein
MQSYTANVSVTHHIESHQHTLLQHSYTANALTTQIYASKKPYRIIKNPCICDTTTSVQLCHAFPHVRATSPSLPKSKRDKRKQQRRPRPRSPPQTGKRKSSELANQVLRHAGTGGDGRVSYPQRLSPPNPIRRVAASLPGPINKCRVPETRAGRDAVGSAGRGRRPRIPSG